MGLSFFGFLIPLLTWRLIQFGKSILFGKSQGFPELYVKRNRILWILAERYNILSANSVEKWRYDESWIQFGKTSYDLEKAGSFAKSCMVKTVKKKWENDNEMDEKRITAKERCITLVEEIF